MSGKRIGGVVCFVVAALLFFGGVVSLNKGSGPALGDSSGTGVSRAVGAFFLPLIAVILGLWLIKKSPGPVGTDRGAKGVKGRR